MKFFISFLIFCFVSANFTGLQAQSRIENFRSTNQKVALVDWYSEFVEPSVNENLIRDARRLINRYSRTFDQAAISQFNFVQNPNNQYFKAVAGELDNTQKDFLTKSGRDNQIDIFVLANLREASSGFDLEMQLYDVRIETLSKMESVRFRLNDRQFALEDLIYRVFNYLDRDGFVHPSPQEFLAKPANLRTSMSDVQDSSISDQGFVAPEELSSGTLAGSVSIGGEKTPFWEQWWFWTVIGGSLLTAGSLSYYFLVINQPSGDAEVTFRMPN